MFTKSKRTPLSTISARILNSVRAKVQETTAYSALKRHKYRSCEELSSGAHTEQVYGSTTLDDILESTRRSQNDLSTLDHINNHGNSSAVLMFSDKHRPTKPGRGGERSDNPMLTEPYRGQLKLSIYINSGLLTIHIVQGRHLCPTNKSTCDSYIKVSLIPEDDQNLTCCTESVPDTNHPHFEEKFSFELLPEDAEKRVLISVCHKDDFSREHELLGCMSFGIQKITEKGAQVHGWYYLLSDDIGHKKHFRESCQQGQGQQQLPQVTEEDTDSPVTYKNIAIVVYRGCHGYGFTLTGGFPAKICRIEPGGAADKAGLKSGDVIVKINREKMYSASVEGVARIIKHCTRKVLVEVQRPQHTNVFTQNNKLPWQPAYNDLDTSMSSSSDEDGEGSLSESEEWWGHENKKCSPTDQHRLCNHPERRNVRFQDVN